MQVNLWREAWKDLLLMNIPVNIGFGYTFFHRLHFFMSLPRRPLLPVLDCTTYSPYHSHTQLNQLMYYLCVDPRSYQTPEIWRSRPCVRQATLLSKYLASNLFRQITSKTISAWRNSSGKNTHHNKLLRLKKLPVLWKSSFRKSKREEVVLEHIRITHSLSFAPDPKSPPSCPHRSSPDQTVDHFCCCPFSTCLFWSLPSVSPFL